MAVFRLAYRRHCRLRLVGIEYVLSLANFSNLFYLNPGDSRTFNVNNSKDVNNSRDADNSRNARNVVDSYSRRGDLTAVDVPGVACGPDVAAANSADDVTCATGIFIIPGVIAVVGFHAVDGVPAAVAVPAVIILCDSPFKNTVFPPKKLCGLVW